MIWKRFVRAGRFWIVMLLVVVPGAVVRAQDAAGPATEATREQALVELTNQAREEAGLKPLTWDAGLAAAAHAHAVRMAAEGPISHRYGGEPDVPERAASAGAHFSLIEENIAVADSAFHVHQSWMKSQAHHDNLLNPKIDRIGVALVPAHGVLYAVADYAQGVASMNAGDVEASVGKVVQGKGLTLLTDAAAARQYCAQESNSDKSAGAGMKPRFLMRWQSADITNLPPELAKALASGQFKQASVGACAPQGGGAAGGPVFSGYRVAVLLY
jgi:Cysteine-rich secretory protein family